MSRQNLQRLTVDKTCIALRRIYPTVGHPVSIGAGTDTLIQSVAISLARVLRKASVTTSCPGVMNNPTSDALPQYLFLTD